MLRKIILFVAMMALATLGVGVASAQDTPSEPPDNLCDAGQAWDDGRCSIPGHEGASALAWECGYYMARVLDGRLSASLVPGQCQHLVQRIAELCRTLEDDVVIACLRSNGTGSLFIDLSALDPEELPPFEFDFSQSLIEIRFVPGEPLSEAECPVVSGYTFVFAEPAGSFGFFTPEELTSLNLSGWMCLYGNESFMILNN